MDDEALRHTMALLRLDDRDPRAWDDLYRMLYPYLLATAYRLTAANRHNADEAVQEAMFRLIRNFDFQAKNSGPASLIAYLRLTIRSVLTDALRTRLRSGEMDKLAGEREEAPEELEYPSSDPTNDLLFRRWLTQSVQTLPLLDQQIVGLLLTGKTTVEIARELQLIDKTAFNRVSLIRARLRKLLSHK